MCYDVCMTIYDRLNDGELVTIDTKDEFWRFACCDCGLVHDMCIEIDKPGQVTMFLFRHGRATAQLRRHHFGLLQNGHAKKWRMVRIGEL